MNRETIDCFFRTIVEMSYLDGITLNDYYFLIEMLNYLNKEDPLYDEIFTFLSSIRRQMFLYSSEEIRYIKENSSLLPLVLSNNPDYVLNSKAFYMFPSEFASGEDMSLQDAKNTLRCFGTNKTYDSISYLQAVEHLSFPDAIKLLTSIFLLGNEESRDIHLVYKYRATLLSPSYAKALSDRMNYLYKLGKDTLENQSVEEFYRKRFGTIMRVRQKEVDQNFQLIRTNKKVKFE